MSLCSNYSSLTLVFNIMVVGRDSRYRTFLVAITLYSCATSSLAYVSKLDVSLIGGLAEMLVIPTEEN